MYRKKPIRKLIPLFFLFLLILGCASGPRFSVETLPRYDACFERNEGWTGGDGVYSVALTKERILWLFGDTWIGKVRNNRHEEAVIVNNTVAIQQGLEPLCSNIDFYFPRSTEGKPLALIRPADGRGWLWIYDGVLTDRGLYLFLIQIERTDDPSGFGFKAVGSWLGHVANPDARPDKWRITQKQIPFSRFSEKGDRLFGSALIKEDSFVYIYGIEEEMSNGRLNKHMIVARAPVQAIGDFKQWRFFGGHSWTSDLSSVKRLFGGAANECSVSFLPFLGKYIIVYTENGISRNMTARLAPRPWGPWGDPFILHQCPEADRHPDIFCYAAKAHPALSQGNGKLIVTYIANSRDFQHMSEDARLYRPRFLRVTFEGGASSR
jgi:hypothetical protein